MTRPVKPGDLAVIVGMRKQAENNGCLVLVGPELQSNDPGPNGCPVRKSRHPGPTFLVTSQGRLLTGLKRGGYCGYPGRTYKAQSRPLHSRFLVPLPPPEDVQMFDATLTPLERLLQRVEPKETAMPVDG
jgi:hypothetical protein